jgi:hypothetical protein
MGDQRSGWLQRLQRQKDKLRSKSSSPAVEGRKIDLRATKPDGKSSELAKPTYSEQDGTTDSQNMTRDAKLGSQNSIAKLNEAKDTKDTGSAAGSAAGSSDRETVQSRHDLSVELWDEAYEGLKNDEDQSSMVASYEKTLCDQLTEGKRFQITL